MKGDSKECELEIQDREVGSVWRNIGKESVGVGHNQMEWDYCLVNKSQVLYKAIGS